MPVAAKIYVGEYAHCVFVGAVANHILTPSCTQSKLMVQRKTRFYDEDAFEYFDECLDDLANGLAIGWAN